jgi:hypothetical protein
MSPAATHSSRDVLSNLPRVRGLRPHSRSERRVLVDALVAMHRRELGDNLVGLATQGSYARGSDAAYSDVELVAFLRAVPGETGWADCVQIHDGMLVDIIWTTPEAYIARVKEITPQWYLAGSDRLGALINEPLIDRVNAYEVRDRHAKCLEQAALRWPATQEAAGKVLNALERQNVESVGRLLFAMLENVLVELAFVNERPFASTSTALVEALALPKRPQRFCDLATIVSDGAYTDLARTSQAVRAVFTELEDLLLDEGLELYEEELVLRPVPER